MSNLPDQTLPVRLIRESALGAAMVTPEHRQREEERARRLHKRLLNDHARIRLKFSAAVNGLEVAVLFAPSMEDHQDMLDRAIGAAGLMPTYFDATKPSSVNPFFDFLPNAKGIVVLNNDAFREAWLSEPMMLWLSEKRADIYPMVVQVGFGFESPKMRICLFRGEPFRILAEESWQLVPDFLMESLGSTPARAG